MRQDRPVGHHDGRFSDGHFHFVEDAARLSGQAGELIVTQRGNVATVMGNLDNDHDRVADIVITVGTDGTPLHASDFLLA